MLQRVFGLLAGDIAIVVVWVGISAVYLNIRWAKATVFWMFTTFMLVALAAFTVWYVTHH